MGRDKALMEHPAGGTLLERAAQLLETVLEPPILLSGDGARYQDFAYPEIADAKSDCGPLGGILAALEHSDPAPVLIMAVDMPHVTEADLRSLLESQGPSLTLAHGAERLHPALSIWDSSTRVHLREALNAGRYALMPLVEALAPVQVELPVEHLSNWNKPQD
jgi:molybdenum cofactor guanylyltransferase